MQMIDVGRANLGHQPKKHRPWCIFDFGHRLLNGLLLLFFFCHPKKTGFEHEKVQLCATCQKMVRSETGSAGVMSGSPSHRRHVATLGEDEETQRFGKDE